MTIIEDGEMIEELLGEKLVMLPIAKKYLKEKDKELIKALKSGATYQKIGEITVEDLVGGE